MYTKLAEPVPAHEGAPHINAPPVYGASPGKPFLYRVPVTGERPMKFRACGLPKGLKFKKIAQGGYVITGMDVVDQIAATAQTVGSDGYIAASNQPVITSAKVVK